MMQFQLSQIADALNVSVSGADVAVSGVTTDSRNVKQGDLFVALKGPNFDGHDHAQKALDAGACAVAVSRTVDVNGSQLLVDDTLKALGEVARLWRRKAAPKVVGLTGSNGKTTLKEMLAAILSQQASTLYTLGNLNNDIGVPLTLARLQDEVFAVIEMGANHPGEIDYLTRLVLPDVAILNNAGRAHLEGFKTLEGVARSKAEIINGLSAGGVFVFNADDNFADLWRELSASHMTRSFGLSAEADVRSIAADYQVTWSEAGFGAHFTVSSGERSYDIQLGLIGQHNRMNALAAIAAAELMGATEQNIVDGLASLKPVAGRLCPVAGLNGMRLVDDSYNANPDSVIAALKVLESAPGKRSLVLGDLGELGDNAEALHGELGKVASEAGIDKLFTVGKLSAAASQSFGAGARHFDDQSELIALLQSQVSAEDSVLVKGSRAAHMEHVVQALSQENSAC